MSTTILGKVSMTPKGAWNAGTSYEPLDVVSYGGSAFLARRANSNVTPVEGDDWQMIAEKATIGNLLQTTGDSTEDAMSQKAATDSFALKEDIVYDQNTMLYNADKLYNKKTEAWCPNAEPRELYVTSTFSGFATSWTTKEGKYVRSLNFKVRSRSGNNITKIKIRIESNGFEFEKMYAVNVGNDLTDIELIINQAIPAGTVWIGIATDQICTFAHDTDSDTQYTYWTNGDLNKLSSLKQSGGITSSLYLQAIIYKDVKFIDDKSISQKKLSFAELHNSTNLFNVQSDDMCKKGYWYYGIRKGDPIEPVKSIHTENIYTAIKVEIFDTAQIVIDSFNSEKARIQYIGAVDEKMCLIDYVFEEKTCPITYEIPAGTKYILISALTVDDRKLNTLTISNIALESYKAYEAPYYYLNDCKAEAPKPEELPIIQTIIGEDANVVKLHMPSEYKLVVGDTFEMFYKGIINAANYRMFDVVIDCKKGDAYSRKFVITPDISEKIQLKTTLYGINHNIIDEKQTILNIASKASSPTSAKNVLCVGDSLTTSGEWPKEFNRRLVGSGGSPSGDALKNINFIGSREFAGVNYEGYGGWTFASYNTENVNTNVQIITCTHNKTSDDQHSIYRDTIGDTWKLETILENEIKIIAVTSEGRNLPNSGTLTWVSGGVNHDNIQYSAATVASGNPFWNSEKNEVDFATYAAKQNISMIDYIYVLLGWNSASATENDYKNDVKKFVNNILAAFPSCKIVLMGLQIPARDGLGLNYGATGIYSRYYDLMQYVWRLDKWYADIASEYPDNVSCISIAGQFDTENNMFESTRSVNVRNAKTETYQTNGVHPAPFGYYQIADAAYRDFVHKLNG